MPCPYRPLCGSSFSWPASLVTHPFYCSLSGGQSVPRPASLSWGGLSPPSHSKAPCVSGSQIVLLNSCSHFPNMSLLSPCDAVLPQAVSSLALCHLLIQAEPFSWTLGPQLPSLAPADHSRMSFPTHLISRQTSSAPTPVTLPCLSCILCPPAAFFEPHLNIVSSWEFQLVSCREIFPEFPNMLAPFWICLAVFVLLPFWIHYVIVCGFLSSVT